MQTSVFHPTPLVSPADLFRAQGARLDVLQARRPALVDMAEQAVREGMALIAPTVWIGVLEICQSGPDGLLLENGFTLHSAYVAQKTAGAKKLAFALGTLGSMVEEIAQERLDVDALQGLMLDSFGSAAAAALGRWAADAIHALAREENLEVSHLLSPGHVDWPVDQGQPQIFSILQPEPALIHLTPSGLILPRKSFSFVMGMGCPAGAASPCEECHLHHSCPMRCETDEHTTQR